VRHFQRPILSLAPNEHAEDTALRRRLGDDWCRFDSLIAYYSPSILNVHRPRSFFFSSSLPVPPLLAVPSRRYHLRGQENALFRMLNERRNGSSLTSNAQPNASIEVERAAKGILSQTDVRKESVQSLPTGLQPTWLLPSSLIARSNNEPIHDTSISSAERWR